MTLRFRNVDASPTDDVRTWPYEALVTAIERGLVADWQPIFSEIRRAPWGDLARQVERYARHQSDDDAAAHLFALAVDRARARAEADDRADVAARIRDAIGRSGLTGVRFAELVGTSASRLSTYASGKVTPSAAMLLRIERFSGATAPRPRRP